MNQGKSLNFIHSTHITFYCFDSHLSFLSCVSVLSPMIMSDPKQPNAFFPLTTIPLLRACGPSVSVAELVLSSGFLSALHTYTCNH